MSCRDCYLDACSAILLARAQLLVATTQGYGVVMAESAYREATVACMPGADELASLRAAGAVRLARPRMRDLDLPAGRLDGLGAGERDTLLLYGNSHGKGFVVTDDGKAARLCRETEIPFVNALLMARLLAWAKFVSAEVAAEATARLLEVGRYSAWVQSFARQTTPKQLEYFLPGSMPSVTENLSS